jgi:hypothetical protein
MTSHTLRAFLTLISLAGLGVYAQAAEWGTITGRIVYDGKAPTLPALKVDKEQNVCGDTKPDESLIVGPDGGLQNAAVYLKTDNVDIAPEYEKTAKDDVVLDNKTCRFEPHVLVLRTTQTLVIKNSDPPPTGHNTKLDALSNDSFNDLIPAGAEIRKAMAKPEALPVKVGCSIHPFMGGWVLVRPNPYAVVTDADGKFEVKDLPAGKELEFQLWQEKSGYLKEAKNKDVKVDKKGRFKLTVKPGENKLGDFVVGPALFKK